MDVYYVMKNVKWTTMCNYLIYRSIEVDIVDKRWQHVFSISATFIVMKIFSIACCNVLETLFVIINYR